MDESEHPFHPNLKTVRMDEYIRANRGMFVSKDADIGVGLAVRLIHGITKLTAGEMQLSRSGEWWVAKAEQDWIVPLEEGTVSSYFSECRHSPELGVNSIQPEIVIAAFADDVVTVSSSGVDVIKQTSSDEILLSRVRDFDGKGRLLAFRVKLP